MRPFHIRTRGDPRVNIQFDGEVMDRPGCIEVVVTLILGLGALALMAGWLM
jgi:hypothetical protein